MDGTTSMVSVLSSAVAKYNPASFLLKGGMSVGSTIGSTLGSTLGAGVGLLRGNSARKSASSASHATAEAAESASGIFCVDGGASIVPLALLLLPQLGFFLS
jgi:hypothetical protein